MSKQSKWQLQSNVKEAIQDHVEKAIVKAMENPALRAVADLKVDAPDAGEILDAEQVFQLFCLFSADAARTALACGLPKEKVEELAEKFSWKEKLATLIDLRLSAKPGDSERGINRSLCFLQAHRLRLLIESIITKLSSISKRDVDELCLATEVSKDGTVTRKIVTRPFADLASAMEKCHSCLYQSLADSAGDRKARNEEPTQEKSLAELHVSITKAMAQVREETKANPQ